MPVTRLLIFAREDRKRWDPARWKPANSPDGGFFYGDIIQVYRMGQPVGEKDCAQAIVIHTDYAIADRAALRAPHTTAVMVDDELRAQRVTARRYGLDLAGLGAAGKLSPVEARHPAYFVSANDFAAYLRDSMEG